jgi:acetyl-CoA carboxylase carboxyl transferase subunit alpha
LAENTREKELRKPRLEQSLPFERRILELERSIAQTEDEDERKALSGELAREQEAVFTNLTAWQRIQLARHPLRPRMLDYTGLLFEDLVELSGDRLGGDDPAVVGGIARFEGRSVVVVGQQKGVSTDEKVARNFGMAHPEGYRKALRLFKLAERLHLPVLTFVDTPAAHPGIEAEQHGQGPAIATNLLEMTRLETPVFSVVLGEGGSGGALGIAVGDRVAMFEHAIYVICPPERLAEILWRDAERKEIAASAMRVTAEDLLQLGVIDVILPEPNGGAHRDLDAACESLRGEVRDFLEGCDAGRWDLQTRQARLRRVGVWREGQ